METVRIYNTLGELVQQEVNTTSVNVERLAQGVYVLEVQTAQKQYYSRFIRK